MRRRRSDHLRRWRSRNREESNSKTMVARLVGMVAWSERGNTCLEETEDIVCLSHVLSRGDVWCQPARSECTQPSVDGLLPGVRSIGTISVLRWKGILSALEICRQCWTASKQSNLRQFTLRLDQTPTVPWPESSTHNHLNTDILFGQAGGSRNAPRCDR